MAAVHSAGALVAAAATALLLSVLAGFLAQWFDPRPYALAAAVGVTALYVPRLLGVTRHPPLLQSTWQVPRGWAFERSRFETALLFGLGLGSGLLTRIVMPAFYLLLLWPFMPPNVGAALLLWGVYALARTMHVWWLAASAPVDRLPASMNRLAAGLMRRARWLARTNAVVMIGAVLWLLL